VPENKAGGEFWQTLRPVYNRGIAPQTREPHDIFCFSPSQGYFRTRQRFSLAEARWLSALRSLQTPRTRFHRQVFPRLCLLPVPQVLSLPRLLSCRHHASRQPFQPDSEQQGGDPLPSFPSPERRPLALLAPFPRLLKTLAGQSYQADPRASGEGLGSRPDGRLRPPARRRGDPGQPYRLIRQSRPPRYHPSDVCLRFLLAFDIWWRKSPAKELS